MQKKAYDKEPSNELYSWAYHLSMADPIAVSLAQRNLSSSNTIHWLISKGVPGKYIIDSLRQTVR